MKLADDTPRVEILGAVSKHGLLLGLEKLIGGSTDKDFCIRDAERLEEAAAAIRHMLEKPSLLRSLNPKVDNEEFVYTCSCTWAFVGNVPQPTCPQHPLSGYPKNLGAALAVRGPVSDGSIHHAPWPPEVPNLHS